ncbi:hypothetical protein KBD69_04220 [Candidatus Woesebacteria bacterium]|nr:hypothetical protein [Candidatus Woesebacteria bacterium]
MTIDRVRDILGVKYAQVSDDALLLWMANLENIAKIAVEQAIIKNILPRVIYEGSSLSSYIRRKTSF